MASAGTKIAAATGAGVIALGLVIFGSANREEADNCLPKAPRGTNLGPSVRAGEKTLPVKTGEYTFTSGFGERWGAQHQGTDLAGPIGTPIYAALGGIVVAAGDSNEGGAGFGNWIIVDSEIDGRTVSTVYGHMFTDGVLVKTGDTVTSGQNIARIGNAGESTGPHLHFEVWPGGRLDGGTAIDPMPWLADAVDPSGTVPGPAVSLAASSKTLGAGCSGLSRPGGSNLKAGSVPPEFEPWIRKAGQTCAAVDGPLIASQLYQENKFRHGAASPVSPSGAAGPGQFMPTTWAAIGKDHDGDGVADVNSIGDSVMAMAEYDCQVAEQTQEWLREGKIHGDATELMLSAYNCGPGATLAAGGVCGFPETQQYVKVIVQKRSEYLSVTAPSGNGSAVAAAAMSWLGTEYAWGGGDVTGPTKGTSDGGVADSFGDFNKVGFDCSGLVIYAVAQATDGRIVLPHLDSAQIADPRGQKITRAADLRPGDVVQPHPGHIWIWMGENKVIEAPQSGGVVQITDWTPPETVNGARFV
ncbi:peptidoglycan DD-metalloendopeptidase family protein [Rhodococcus sp. NPDC003318]|uniref:peptidoglycan DD-metalloendopeptidase family protein n=1 Tax=Rhodococcus sp. NPDC003318 TaxID=3364503 RepID=UPI00367838AB